MSPYLVIGGNDAIHFCKMSDKVYRFSPCYMPNELLKPMHGHDERIPVQSLNDIVEFYIRLVRKL